MRMYRAAATVSTSSVGVLLSYFQSYTPKQPSAFINGLGLCKRYLEQSMGACLADQVVSAGKAVSLLEPSNTFPS
jgi:hypothetical protein